MTRDDILTSLFAQHDVALIGGGLIAGKGRLTGGGDIHVLGIVDQAPLGIEDALTLAGRVLAIVRSSDRAPILVLIDSASQRMSRRDELLGLNEYLSHLAKALLLAHSHGHRTIGLLYGGSAAGAFIATALATQDLIALPDACPEVMDLPSMARVTKLPLDVLKAKALETPVFAPGLDNLARTGAIHAIWDSAEPLAPKLAALLAQQPGADMRGHLGAERGGRIRAAAIAERVAALVAHD